MTLPLRPSLSTVWVWFMHMEQDRLHLAVKAQYCCWSLAVLQVQQLLAGKPLLLQLAGLDHMGDDPTDMHVLYLQVGRP